MNEALAKALWGNAVPESEPSTTGATTMNDDHDNAITDREALEKFAMCGCGHAKADHHAGNTDPEECYAIVRQENDADVFCACTRFGATPTGEVFDADAPNGSGWDSERHCATDLRGADWAGRKLREAEEQIGLNLRMHEAHMAELQKMADAAEARLEAACKPFAKSVDFFRNALEVYAETHREDVLKGLRTKTRLLPSGVRIGWKERKAGYRWDQQRTPTENKAALLAWAENEAETTGECLTRDNPVPDLDAIKRHLGLLGEAERTEALNGAAAPPGLEWVGPGEELRIETGVELPKEET